MSKAYVIDGNSLLFRAFYATYRGDPSQIMRSRDGTPTNAIFAFGRMIGSILGEVKEGDLFFVAFDADGDTFRKEELDSYKANRAPCPSELIPQFPISRELLTAVGAFHYELHGYEADDLAGTVATLSEKEGYEVEIYTSDKDYLQLVSPLIHVNLMKTGLKEVTKVTTENIVGLFGYRAEQTVDFKGLRGDASDNLKGIPGIGEKGAVKLLAKYGDFENIVAHADEIGGKAGAALKEHVEEGRLSYRLAKIKRDVPLPFGSGDLLYRGYRSDEVGVFAAKYDLTTFPMALPPSWGKTAVRDIEILHKTALKELLSAQELGLYLDFDDPSYHLSNPKGIALSDGAKSVYLKEAEITEAIPLLHLALASARHFITYSRKEAHYYFHRLGIEFSAPTDELLSAAYLLSPDIAGRKEAVFSLLSLPYPKKEDGEKGALLAAASFLDFGKVVRRLKEEGIYALYEEVERPLSLILAEMEEEGVPLDEKLLVSIGAEFKKKRDDSAMKVLAYAKEPLNLNSPVQVATFLYEELGLPKVRGKTTSSDALLLLAKEHPVAADLLTYRKYEKLVSTYIDGLLPHLDGKGRVHTYFNQALTSTGRLSSSEPNLQNIAGRDEESSLVKEAFHYEDGSYFLSLDYSQIELRVLASIADCPAYIKTFESGLDVHEETARKIFRVEHPSHRERQKAKAVNFAVVYGSSKYGLSEQIGCSPAEADALITDFYAHYPEVKTYLDGAVAYAEKHGYCLTYFGRRRYLPDLHSPIHWKREAAHRQALNAPIQGTAADIIKKAMVKADALLREGGHKTRMILQIHDELLFKVPPEEIGVIEPLLKEAMETSASLKVPLLVAGGYGKSWKEAKE